MLLLLSEKTVMETQLLPGAAWKGGISGGRWLRAVLGCRGAPEVEYLHISTHRCPLLCGNWRKSLCQGLHSIPISSVFPSPVLSVYLSLHIPFRQTQSVSVAMAFYLAAALIQTLSSDGNTITLCCRVPLVRYYWGRKPLENQQFCLK